MMIQGTDEVARSSQKGRLSAARPILEDHAATTMTTPSRASCAAIPGS